MIIRYNISDKLCPGSRIQKCPTPDHCESHCHFDTAELETRKVKPYPCIPKDEFELSNYECSSTHQCIAVSAGTFLGAIVITLFMVAVIIINSAM
jgi:hypothetical protein